MDDLIITKSNTKEIEAFKSSMKTKFDMTDFGFLNSYLGIEVIQGKFEIKICQTTYALKVLEGPRGSCPQDRRRRRMPIFVTPLDDFVSPYSKLTRVDLSFLCRL